jgi:hypothetical protein
MEMTELMTSCQCTLPGGSVVVRGMNV